MQSAVALDQVAPKASEYRDEIAFTLYASMPTSVAIESRSMAGIRNDRTAIASRHQGAVDFPLRRKGALSALRARRHVPQMAEVAGRMSAVPSRLQLCRAGRRTRVLLAMHRR